MNIYLLVISIQIFILGIMIYYCFKKMEFQIDDLERFYFKRLDFRITNCLNLLREQKRIQKKTVEENNDIRTY
jgi:hypothetical protein